MEPMAADGGRNPGLDYVTFITFVFPANLYSFQGLAGRVRPAVGIFVRGAWSCPKTGTHFSGSCLLKLGMIFSENRYPLFGIMPYE